MPNQQSQSLGEQRVRASFNPSKDGKVDEIKRLTADLIDLCHQEADRSSAQGHEIGRLWSLAMTHYEDAAMWAVKAATAEKS